MLAVAIGAAGYLWIGKQQNQQPPNLVLTSSEQIRESSGQFTVPFAVTNQGRETAESVQIVAQLRIDGVEETGELNSNYSQMIDKSPANLAYV